MYSRRDARALLAIVVTLVLVVALLVVVFPIATRGVAADVCPEEGKVESEVDGDLDDIVLPAGTLVCIKAGNDLVEVVADGESTLAELIDNGHNVSHYTILDETTTTTQSDEEPTTTTLVEETTSTQSDEEPTTTTTILDSTTTTLGLGDVAAVCVGDIPFLSYVVDFPGASSVDITFLNPSGVDLTYPDRPLSGQVLWPGASDVFPFDWPGWSLVDGAWIEDDDGFLWAREIVTVVFTVNPSAEVQVGYPEATSECANPPATPPDSSSPTTQPTLPFTGADNPRALALTGVALAALGLLGLLVSRTRSES